MRFLLIQCRVLFFVLGIALAIDVAAQEAEIDGFFDDFAAEWVRGNPNQAVRTRYFSGDEQNRLEQQLTPLTEAWQRERIELARQGLNDLASFNDANLTKSQHVSTDVMQWQLETLIEAEPFLGYAFPLQQFNGANVTLINELTVVHPIRTERDAANYLARLAQLGERMAEATTEAVRRSGDGVRPPRFILQATLDQMEQFLSPNPTDNPLVSTFTTKMQSIEGLANERRQLLSDEATRIVENEVYPAWREALAALRSQLPLATDDAGLWRFEQGADVYAYQLKRYTTTDLTADEIHQIGLREVSRLEAEMDGLLRQIGLSTGSINDRALALRARLSYPETEEGRERIMADIDGMVRDAEARATELFDLQPIAQVIAQPYPRFRWPSAAASYTAPPLDGSRSGVFQMPLREDRMTEHRLRTLVYHETVPGHHFHVALMAENSELPRFRQARVYGGISASTEGWALYAERLAAESGWYEDDVEGLIGQLDSALFRARRLVVDTGLHAKQWTRQQAIDYGIEPSEVERYIVMPGQACSYMIGRLKIAELREKAMQALGDDFSIREFHNVVLGVGSVPLTILEGEVDEYIAGVETR